MVKEGKLMEKQENTDNVIDLSGEKKNRQPILALGGSNTSEENWLRSLKEGTVFLAKDKKTDNDIQLGKYLVAQHFEHTTALIIAMPNQEQMEIYVTTLPFSRKFKLVETIGFFPPHEIEQEQEEEHTDGDSNRSV